MPLQFSDVDDFKTTNAKFFLDMTLAFSNANALTVLQQIRSGRFVIGCLLEQKSNLSGRFKFEPIITNYL